MTDAPETMDAMIVKLAINSARVEERKVCAELRDEHRALMRAASALCSVLQASAASRYQKPETLVCLGDLEALLVDYDPTEE